MADLGNWQFGVRGRWILNCSHCNLNLKNNKSLHSLEGNRKKQKKPVNKLHIMEDLTYELNSIVNVTYRKNMLGKILNYQILQSTIYCRKNYYKKLISSQLNATYRKI